MSPVIYLGPEFAISVVRESLKPISNVVHVNNHHELISSIKNAHAILDASMKYRITDELVEKAQKLKVISCATTGSDHIDRTELKKKNVPVFTLKDDPDLLENMTPAAELSWTLLLACARKLKGALSHVTDGNWVREEFPGKMLFGSTLGLIGCGRIGGWMAKYGQAFGMDILAFDPYKSDLQNDIEETTLEDLISRSDFISIHVHLSDETYNLVSKEVLEKCKPGSVLINTSRGGIVNERALLDLLNNGRLAAVGLDVLEGEPDIENHPLVEYAKNHHNLLITPHCGGFSPDAVRLVCKRAADKIYNILNHA